LATDTETPRNTAPQATKPETVATPTPQPTKTEADAETPATTPPQAAKPETVAKPTPQATKPGADAKTSATTTRQATTRVADAKPSARTVARAAGTRSPAKSARRAAGPQTPRKPVRRASRPATNATAKAAPRASKPVREPFDVEGALKQWTETARKATGDTLELYVKTVDTLAGAEVKAAHATRLPIVVAIAETNAAFSRGIAGAYVAAARDLLKA
jgi:hypothetical protein